MMNRKRWKHLIAAVMCATLVLSTPAVYAAEEQPNVQTEVKEEKAQDTEQKKEEVKEEVTSADTMQETTDTNTSQVESSASKDIKETPENNRYPSAIYQHAIYLGTGDVTFKFDKGAGDYEVKDIKKVQVFFDGLLDIDSSAKDETLFSYDLDKGEFTMKESILKGSQKESLYCVTLVVTLKNNESYVLSSSTNGNWQYVYVDEESNTDENGFVIKDGVLVKYTGTASEVTIPEGVTSIGERAFFQNKNITGLTFPSSLKSIGDFAFEACSNLGDLTIPSNITYIGMGAFMAESATAMKNLTINGNNTTIADGAFAYRDLKEVILSGSFTSIGQAAFDAQAMNSVLNITVNGVIESLGDAFPMTSIGKFIVNGDIKHIEGDNIFINAGKVTIYCKEGSYIQTYAKDRNISFVVIKGTPDEPSNPKHEVTLPVGQTSLPKSEMQNLLAKNATDDIVLKTPSGVAFTFPKGSMKLIDGKENYDFGVELITDFNKVTNTPFNKDTFAFQINYNYDGELPGTAKISIPVDSKWVGKTLYYYRIMGEGIFDFTDSAVVDANGMYTITQTHCSDYVATTQAPDNNGNPTKPSNNNTINTNTKTTATTSPKTGDTSAIWLYLALMMGAGVSVIVAKRKSKIK